MMIPKKTACNRSFCMNQHFQHSYFFKNSLFYAIFSSKLVFSYYFSIFNQLISTLELKPPHDLLKLDSLRIKLETFDEIITKKFAIYNPRVLDEKEL